MPRTLAEMVTSIRTDLNRGAAFDARITESIKTVIQLFRSRAYTFNRKRAGLSISSEYTTLPADFLEIESLRLDDNGKYILLDELPALEVDDLVVDPSYTSTPVYYSIITNGQDSEARCYPAPDATYSARLVYTYDLATSASWTDNLTLAWFDEGFLVVKYGALSEINTAYIGGEDGARLGMQFAQMTDVAERAIKRESNLRRHSGKITPCM